MSAMAETSTGVDEAQLPSEDILPHVLLEDPFVKNQASYFRLMASFLLPLQAILPPPDGAFPAPVDPETGAPDTHNFCVACMVEYPGSCWNSYTYILLQGGGELICCDDCPASYHYDCLNPPLRVQSQTSYAMPHLFYNLGWLLPSQSCILLQCMRVQASSITKEDSRENGHVCTSRSVIVLGCSPQAHRP